jgi:hypothetical protein
MSELEALRSEIEDLRAQLKAIRDRSGEAEPSQSDVDAYVRRRLKETIEKEGGTGGIAVYTVVVADNGKGGVGSAHSLTTTARADRLPTAAQPNERFVGFATRPLVARAVRALVAPHFEGRQMSVAKGELAASLGISEGELEAALRPLVADGTLKWTKDADGAESFEIADYWVLPLLYAAA